MFLFIYLMILAWIFLYHTSNVGWDSHVGFSIFPFYINMIKEGKDKLL